MAKNNMSKLIRIQLGKAREQGRVEGITQAVEMYGAAVAYVLHDKHDSNKESIKVLLNDIGDLFTYISDGTISLEDLQTTLLDECGLDLKGGIICRK